MKICLILEGSYPYVRGGVSTWTDAFIRSMPEIEFVLWTICETEDQRGQFAYELPKNVVSVVENFLDTSLKLKASRNVNMEISGQDREAISQLIRCQEPDWRVLFGFLREKCKNPLDILMSEDFLDILKDFSKEEYLYAGFLDLFWTLRSMFVPLFYLVGQDIPEADSYHSISTGYAGVLAALGSMKYYKPMVLTEHGIYTREREEEILRSDWVEPNFKSLWVSMFYMFSRLAYQHAHRVTALYSHASEIQQEMGCPAEKCEIIGNGVNFSAFRDIATKSPNGWIDIGAIVRFAPIKDIKTMIYAFSRLKQEIAKVRLHILGAIDDQEYYQECLSLIEYLEVKDISIPGLVDSKMYLQRLDFTILTSLSEGQPFAILESLAAGRPLVATDVGSCRELIEGRDGDTLGPAGICVPPMHQTALLGALIDMCENDEMRKKMAVSGQERIEKYYEQEKMIADYKVVYEKAKVSWQA